MPCIMAASIRPKDDAVEPIWAKSYPAPARKSSKRKNEGRHLFAWTLHSCIFPVGLLLQMDTQFSGIDCLQRFLRSQCKHSGFESFKAYSVIFKSYYTLVTIGSEYSCRTLSSSYHTPAGFRFIYPAIPGRVFFARLTLPVANR